MVFDRKRRSSRWPVSRRTNFRTMIVARKICNNSCATITSSLMEWKERKRENVWKSARYSGQLEFPCDNRWCIKNHRRNESSYRVFANVYQHYRKDRGKNLFTDNFLRLLKSNILRETIEKEMILSIKAIEGQCQRYRYKKLF